MIIPQVWALTEQYEADLFSAFTAADGRLPDFCDVAKFDQLVAEWRGLTLAEIDAIRYAYVSVVALSQNPSGDMDQLGNILCALLVLRELRAALASAGAVK